MPFEKGHKGYKPKGAVSQKTKDWEKLGDYITNAGAQRFAKVMTRAEDEEFMKYFSMILEYFKPKQSRQELAPPDGGQLDFSVRVVQNPKNSEQDNGEKENTPN